MTGASVRVNSWARGGWTCSRPRACRQRDPNNTFSIDRDFVRAGFFGRADRTGNICLRHFSGSTRHYYFSHYKPVHPSVQDGRIQLRQESVGKIDEIAEGGKRAGPK
jgi:hypothetical protein